MANDTRLARAAHAHSLPVHARALTGSPTIAEPDVVDGASTPGPDA